MDTAALLPGDRNKGPTQSADASFNCFPKRPRRSSRSFSHHVCSRLARAECRFPSPTSPPSSKRPFVKHVPFQIKQGPLFVLCLFSWDPHISDSNCDANPRHIGYRWKAGSEMRTMAVSLVRSDVLGAQECDLAESQGSRDVSGSVLPQNLQKIEFGLIRWAGPSSRVFTAIFLAYLQV